MIGSNAPLAGSAIVLGAPRSGTTFLMGALGAMRGVECVTGNLLPVGIAHLAGREREQDDLQTALERSFRGALSDYLASGTYNSRAAALGKWWSTGRPLSRLAPAVRGTRDERLLAYKEPFLAFAPALAYRALPGARIVHIFRDGRDVADSLVRSYDVLSDRRLADLESNEVQLGRAVDGRYVPWWVSDEEQGDFLCASPYMRAIWMWREMLRRCRSFFAKPEVKQSQRVLDVRYEELIRDPLAEGERIARHLGASLTPHVRRQLASAHPRSIDIHLRREPAEIAAAEQIAGDELLALGYPLRSFGSEVSSEVKSAPSLAEAP